MQGVTLASPWMLSVMWSPAYKVLGRSRECLKDICLSNALSPLHVQVKELMRVLERPFDEQPGAEKYKVAAPKEIRMGVELLSCSS